MKYYLIAALKLNLTPLTYQSSIDLKQGVVVDISVRGKKTQGVILSEVEKPHFKCLEAKKSEFYFSEFQQTLANFISAYYCCALGLAYGIFLPHKAILGHSSNCIDSSLDSAFSPKNPLAILSQAQNKALDFILSHEKTLLFGDTGSGKTEIYIHAMHKVLESGKNVLFLMPEIALTPQMESRLKAVFGDLVCIWHSKINKRKKTLESLQDGRFRIVVGARSALFTPLDNIGLIIIDEEHDDSYKSNSTPRYNARDLAIYIAKKCGIRLILGSATPSVVSYYNFAKNGEIFRLKGRYFESQKQVSFENTLPNVSEILLHKIRQVLNRGQQVIVFVPIRANFKTLICKDCGYSLKCKNCSVCLSFHHKKNAFMCHYCGYAQAGVSKCPECGGSELSGIKIGTQEVAKQLQSEFSNHKVAIFDRDEITTDGKLKKVLSDFSESKIDILVGTQMVSKGHDYHNVALVAILGIDYLLFGNDYRSYERGVSLFHQIAGRAGRKDSGEIFVQSKNKEFFSEFLEDYEDFIKFELENREDFYPPFRRLALISVSHKDEFGAKKIIENCKKIVKYTNDIEIVGSSPAPIERINNKWRYFLLLRSKDFRAINKAVNALANEPCEIDIDPVQLL